MSILSKALGAGLMAAVMVTAAGCCCVGVPGLGGLFGPGAPDLGLPEVTVEPQPGEEGPAPAGDLADIPTYPGARPQEGGDLPFWFRAMTGQYARFDWRVYRTGDPVNRVVEFYDREMPTRGWEGAATGMGEEMGEAAGGAMLTYGKDEDADGDPQTVALIFVGREGNDTSIIIVRAQTRE